MSVNMTIWDTVLMADETSLTFASSDGSVSTVPVRQTETSAGKQSVSLGEIQVVDEGDQRSITCLRWLGVRRSSETVILADSQSLLVWTKAATVHLWRLAEADGYRWSGVRTVRLERVGGWASANALGAAVSESTQSEADGSADDRLRASRFRWPPGHACIHDAAYHQQPAYKPRLGSPPSFTTSVSRDT